MTNAFSWRNSVSLCPALFFTPRPNLPVTPGISWLLTFAFQIPHMIEIIWYLSFSFWLPLLGMLISAAAAAAKSLQSCPTLCDPIDGSPPGSPVPGILQARTLEWVAISFSNAWVKSESEVTQSCLTLGDPMDFNLSGSSAHGVFQARELEWGAIAFN